MSLTPSDESTIHLILSDGLLIAQFFGAFNDNAWKLMVALLAIRQATAQMAPGPELETAAQTQTVGCLCDPKIIFFLYGYGFCVKKRFDAEFFLIGFEVFDHLLFVRIAGIQARELFIRQV